MIVKSEKDIECLRRAGRMLAAVLQEAATLAVPGVTTAELDLAAERHIRAEGGVPAFLNYKPDGARYPYPAVMCISINDEVVHGIPSEVRVLAQGDLVTLDLGLSYEGYFVDSAVTICVGRMPTPDEARLLEGTKEALHVAIAAVHVGGHIGDIGAAAEVVADKYKLSIIEELGGHAVGKSVHEKPFIPNVGEVGQGPKIVAGMVLAIEPIFSLGSEDITLDEDEWTYRTDDGSLAAHFEHTILVTKDGVEVLTK